jgi:hypothetical protein
MTSILGLDISSFQLNGCLLIDDQPPILRVERLGGAKDPLIERVRRVRAAINRFTYLSAPARPPEWIVIEDSFGAHRVTDRALHKTTGAIISSCPRASQVALISSGDWRKALGAKNTKADGHRAVFARIAHQKGVGERIESYDEHELDACGIAYAWAFILAGQVAS